MLLILGALLIVSWIAAVTKTKWFPYPGSWLKALGLAIPTWFGSVAGFSVSVWVAAYSSVSALDGSLEIFNFLLVIAAVCLVVSLVWYLFLILLYSMFLRLLWSDVPGFLRWIRPPQRKRDIFFAWVVCTLASAVAAVPLLLHIAASTDLDLEVRHYSEIFTEEVMTLMFVGWYITAAYLYHGRSLLRSRRLRRKA